MKYIIIIIIILNAIFAQTDENQSFKLKDGTMINGTVIEENDNTYTIQTKYGSVTVKKNELVQKEYEINLKSGETFSGMKLSETEALIQLKTKFGVLNIEKTNILDIKEVGEVSQTESLSGPSESELYFMNKKSSLLDSFFGSSTPNKNTEFALGEERLTDTFFDPTAYVLDEGTLYLSGLSFGFGVSEKLTIFSKWVNYFWSDFNIAPKYMIFQKGNWEKESALAIGGHFHTYWKPDKVQWQQGTIPFPQTREYWRDEDGVETTYWRENSERVEEDTTFTKYYGGYIPLGARISGEKFYTWNNDWDSVGYRANINESDDLDYMVELNVAYTFSKARKGMRGRVSNTLGALVQAPVAEGYEWPYRIFWGADVDITPKLKMVGEVFYDKFFLDLINTDGPFDLYTYKVSNKEVTEDDFPSIRPIHFDFGFMYAVNEHFRFGIHNQPYIITFYWKF